MIIKEQLSSVQNKRIYSTSRDQSTFSKYSKDSFEISQKDSNGLSTFDILQEGHRAARVAEIHRLKTEGSYGNSLLPTQDKRERVSLEISPEVAPEETLKKVHSVKQAITTSSDPTLRDASLYVRAHILERRAKAQLHKSELAKTQRIVLPPRSI